MERKVAISYNGIKLTAYPFRKFLRLGCVMLVRWQVCEAVLFY